MKKLILAVMAMVALTAQAQLTGDGYYRVQNKHTSRYIIVINDKGSLNLTSQTADLSSLLTIKNFSNVESDPSSIIYIKEDGAGSGNYRLQSQGIDTYTMVGYYLHQIQVGDAYGVYASAQGLTKYLWEQDIYDKNWQLVEDTGRVITPNPDQQKQLNKEPNRRLWYVKPVNQTDDQYFGVAPQTQVGSMYYQTFYAAFPFSFASSGRKAYYVEQVDETFGAVVWSEISGTVPASVPVIIGCPSATAKDNKLNVGATSPVSVTGNQLKGVYFSRYDKGNNIDNRVMYDPQTMRVLGKTSDGRLGFVTAQIDCIPHNTAYLTVSPSAPAELVLMTRTEYEQEKAADKLTIKANDAQRQYGEQNPVFTYTTEGTIKSGEPQLTTEATPQSPVGTYPIVVSRGTVTNKQLTTVNGSLTITKCPLTVTAQSYTIKQTDALPTFAVTYQGFKLNETEAVLTVKPTITCNVPADKAPGTYQITVSGAQAQNYDMTYVAGTLTILQADPITITADNQQKVYGDAVPALTWRVEGSSVEGQPVLTTTATEQSPVGVYDINVAAGTVNYPNLTLVGGKLTVVKAPLTITAQSYTIKQNEALPVFEVAYDGFKLNETETVLTTKPTITCNVPEAKTPGTYQITVAGADAQNYDVAYVAGTLTILQADPITITADNQQKVYGDAVPALTWRVEGGSVEGQPVLTTTATEQSPVGVYDINVAAGTVNYPNLTLVGGKLTVVKAPLTITAQSYVIKQNETLPVFEVAYDGFKLNETEAVLTTKPTITCNVPAEQTPGTYDIVVSDADAQNYEVSYVAGKLTILEADEILVKVSDATMTYGDEVPVFTYTVEGGEVTGEPVITCEATSLSNAGEYVIVIEKGTINYPKLKLQNGTLTITKALLTAKAHSYEREQGQENPVFELDYEGFRNGDDVSVLTQEPVATTVATPESEVGEYAITVSGGEALNYTFTYVDGVLTVTTPSAIRAICFDRPVDVYTLTGRKVRSGVTSLQGLPRGIYVVNGRKVVVAE